MRSISAVFVLAFIGMALAVTVVRPGSGDRPPNGADTPLFDIDTFENGDNSIVIQITRSNTFPVEAQSIYPGSGGTGSTAGIIGGERDLYTRIDNSDVFPAVVTSAIVQDTSEQTDYWTVSTPGGVSGVSWIQWDGVDGDGEDLNQNGLGGTDLLFNGNAGYVYVRISNDISCEYEFLIVGTSGQQCTYTLSLAGTDGEPAPIDFYIGFNEFTNGGACFRQVGAIQATSNQVPNLDAQLFFFQIYGTNPSPSNTNTATRTPSPVPSQSNTNTATRTPSPAPSQSRTPSPAPPTPSNTRTPSPVPSESRTPTPTPTSTRTPTPTPSPECICRCPAFTCALIFDRDDDANNVYYFSGTGFTRSITTGGVNTVTNDNSNSNNSNSNNNDSGNLDSSASVLTVSIAVIAMIVALF